MSRKDLQSVTHPPSRPPAGQRDAFHSPDRYLFFNVLRSSGLISHIARVLTAGDDRIRRRGIRPQLAPDAPALRDWRRQETLLLDD